MARVGPEVLAAAFAQYIPYIPDEPELQSGHCRSRNPGDWI